MDSTIFMHSVIVAAKDQVSRDLGGEAVILNLQSGVYFGLEPVGTRIWHLIQEPRAAKEVRDAVLVEYDVEPEKCEGDLLAFLHDLAAERLIEVNDGTDR